MNSKIFFCYVIDNETLQPLVRLLEPSRLVLLRSQDFDLLLSHGFDIQVTACENSFLDRNDYLSASRHAHRNALYILANHRLPRKL